MRVTTACSVTNARMRISQRASRTHLDVDRVHQPQQLRPAPTPRLERRPRSHLALHVIVRRLLPRTGEHHAALSPPTASPARVRSVVAHTHLALARDVLHQSRQELHCGEAVHAHVRAVDCVRDQLHLGALGVVAQA